MSNLQGSSESLELLQLVSFMIGSEEFGIDILKVQEINRMYQITQMPNSPEYVDGVINLRGKIIPVIDLRAKLSMGRKEHDKDTRIVVVDLSGRTVGFIVDRVKEVLRIPGSIIEAPPEMASSGLNSDFITGVGKLQDRLLLLLDLDRVLPEAHA